MKLKKALVLRKAKYIKRWKGKDGSWKYKYTTSKKGKQQRQNRIAVKLDALKQQRKVIAKQVNEAFDAMIAIDYKKEPKLYDQLDQKHEDLVIKRNDLTDEIRDLNTIMRAEKLKEEQRQKEKMRSERTNPFLVKGTKVKIVLSGSKNNPEYRIMTSSGSYLSDMFFDSPEQAEEYARKKNLSVVGKQYDDRATRTKRK